MMLWNGFQHRVSSTGVLEKAALVQTPGRVQPGSGEGSGDGLGGLGMGGFGVDAAGGGVKSRNAHKTTAKLRSNLLLNALWPSDTKPFSTASVPGKCSLVYELW